MTPTLNILVTAASRRVPLVLALKKALADGGVAGRVVVTDVNPLSPAVHVADGAYAVPLSTEPDYVSTIDAICTVEDTGLIVPTIDDELPVFAAALPRFRARGISVAVSPLETTLACNDKFATCTQLREGGVAAARTWLPEGVPDDVAFPLFVKPRFGRGSVGAFRVESRRHLAFFLDYVESPVVQEYLTGPEFTLDTFCDAGGVPVGVVPRERVVIRAGVIDRGRTNNAPELIALALDCARVLRFYGPINIQCRVMDGVPIVFEINPRFSGGIPLTIAAGADFARFLVDLTLGRPLPTPLAPFTDGLWMTNYEAGIFLAEERFATLRPPPVAAAERR